MVATCTAGLESIALTLIGVVLLPPTLPTALTVVVAVDIWSITAAVADMKRGNCKAYGGMLTSDIGASEGKGNKCIRPISIAEMESRAIAFCESTLDTAGLLTGGRPRATLDCGITIRVGGFIGGSRILVGGNTTTCPSSSSVSLCVSLCACRLDR